MKHTNAKLTGFENWIGSSMALVIPKVMFKTINTMSEDNKNTLFEIVCSKACLRATSGNRNVFDYLTAHLNEFYCENHDEGALCVKCSPFPLI